MKSFGKKICKLIVGRNVYSFQDTSLNLFPHKVTINLDVFGALMVDWIGSDVKSRLIIRVKQGWSAVINLQLLKQPKQPNNLTSSVGHRSVFNLCGRTRDNLWLLRFPRDERRSKKNAETSKRASSVRTCTPIRIWESLELKCCGWRKDLGLVFSWYIVESAGLLEDA